MQNQEMNEAGNTSFTDIRRRYPKDVIGAKDEWRALIKHQHEINELINQRERELKKLKQEDLGKAYDQKRSDDIRQKEQQLAQKQEEAYRVQSHFEAYKNDMNRQKEDKNFLKEHLANSYESHIDSKHQQEQFKKELTKHEEQQMIENAKRRVEEAQRRELIKQQEEHRIFNEEIRRAEDKNQKLLDNKIQEKLEYRDNIRENEKKQILKEENYRNFFKLSVENQKKLMDLHAQNVLNPALQKNAQLDHIVEARINEERERKVREEVNKQQWRDHNLHDVSKTNKDKMDHKDYVKDLERQDKQFQVQESLKQSMEYQDFISSTKNVKKENQKHYKDFLDRQQQEQIERERLNKMTKHEKKMNLGDLHSFKGLESKMYGLVPGFMHSKYEHPLGGTEIQLSPGRRNNVNIYAEKLAAIHGGSGTNFNQGSPTQQDKYQQNNSHVVEQSQASPVRSRNYEINNVSSPVDAYARTSTNMNKTFEPRDLSPNYRSMTQMPTMGSPTSVKGGHNPITNPLPFNNQNPYIAREIHQYAGTKRPYFANMATNNLLG